VDLGRPARTVPLTRTQRQIEVYRKADAVVEVRDARGQPCPGVPVWVEQESHEFLFGCVEGDLAALSDADRARYRARLAEVFNRIETAEPPFPIEGLRIDFPDRTHLGVMRRQLEAPAGDRRLDVHVRGQTVGMPDADERESGRRLADLYTLCFAEPRVRGIFWHGFWDGEQAAECGLLRRDLSPRPAFRLLQKLVDVTWHTRAAGVTDADGRFRFRGFYGGYRVGVPAGERAEVALFPLGRGPEGVAPWRVTLPR